MGLQPSSKCNSAICHEQGKVFNEPLMELCDFKSLSEIQRVLIQVPLISCTAAVHAPPEEGCPFSGSALGQTLGWEISMLPDVLQQLLWACWSWPADAQHCSGRRGAGVGSWGQDTTLRDAATFWAKLDFNLDCSLCCSAVCRLVW